MAEGCRSGAAVVERDARAGRGERLERARASSHRGTGAARRNRRSSRRGFPASSTAPAARPRRRRAGRRERPRDIRPKTTRRSRSSRAAATPSRCRLAATRSIERVEFGVGQALVLVHAARRRPGASPRRGGDRVCDRPKILPRRRRRIHPVSSALARSAQPAIMPARGRLEKGRRALGGFEVFDISQC